MKNSPIQWTVDSVNLTTFACDGCEMWQPRVIDPATGKPWKKCYAGRMAERVGGLGAFDKPIQMISGRARAMADLPDLRGQPKKGKPWIPLMMPRIIFVGDMADTLSRGVSFQFLRDELVASVTSPRGCRHVWMWPTKQAKRLVEFAAWLQSEGVAWPRNLWPGVSVTSTRTLWRAEYLVQVPAAVRFISYAPAWEWVDFSPFFDRVQMMIVEGESGYDAVNFDVQIAYRLISQCRERGVAPFVKQLGSHTIGLGAAPASRAVWQDSHGGDWLEWPQDLRVREYPAVPAGSTDSAGKEITPPRMK